MFTPSLHYGKHSPPIIITIFEIKNCENYNRHELNSTLKRYFNSVVNNALNKIIMVVTANELKTKGVKAIENKLKNSDSVMLTVRGITKYVIIPVEEYDRMRESELDLAIIQINKDIEEGNYTEESSEEHLNRLWND